MSDELSLDGKQYISSKRASQLSGYAQDYIGQIARKGLIDAQRIGGLWYVSMESLEAYKTKAESYKPQPPERIQPINPESLITFDGKDYISASRASDVTGYNQDYVGQLARSGAILSRQVGNRWYIEREGILAHKKEKDALLAAVQSESVGIRTKADPVEPSKMTYAASDDQTQYLTYTSDSRDLMPIVRERSDETAQEKSEPLEFSIENEEVSIPIRVVRKKEILEHRGHVKTVKSGVRRNGKTIFYGTLASAALTIVIVLSFGFSTLKESSVYAIAPFKTIKNVAGNTLTANAWEAFQSFSEVLEKWIVPELSYKRSQ